MINLSRHRGGKGRHVTWVSGGAAARRRAAESTAVGAEHLGVEPIVETIGPHDQVVIQREQVGFPDRYRIPLGLVSTVHTKYAQEDVVDDIPKHQCETQL
jgi:hypothetical protein